MFFLLAMSASLEVEPRFAISADHFTLNPSSTKRRMVPCGIDQHLSALLRVSQADRHSS